MAAKRKRKSPKGKKRKKSKKKSKRKGKLPDWLLQKRARKLNSLAKARGLSV